MVRCRTSSGVLVDDSTCDAATRPRNEASCRIATCPTSTTVVSYTSSPETSWRTGGWTEVSLGFNIVMTSVSHLLVILLTNISIFSWLVNRYQLK